LSGTTKNSNMAESTVLLVQKSKDYIEESERMIKWLLDNNQTTLSKVQEDNIATEVKKLKERAQKLHSRVGKIYDQQSQYQPTT